MTREEAIREHRKMWNWIADETEKQHKIVTKQDYVEKFGLDAGEESCFLCKYSYALTLSLNSTHSKCVYCPLDWESEEYILMCCTINVWTDGYYGLWDDAQCKNDWEKAAKYARIIANLKEREL